MKSTMENLNFINSVGDDFPPNGKTPALYAGNIIQDGRLTVFSLHGSNAFGLFFLIISNQAKRNRFCYIHTNVVNVLKSSCFSERCAF